MAEEHVKDWIRKKLDKGVDPDRLRKTLEKTDRDPSLVEEVRRSDADSPFEEEGQEKDTSSEADSADTSVNAQPQSATSQEEEPEPVPDEIEAEPVGEEGQENAEGDEDPFDSLNYVDQDDTEESGQDTEADEGSGFSLPSIGLPSVSTPSTSLGGRKAVALVVVVLLVGGLGYGGYQMFGDTVKDEAASSVSNILDAQCDGDMGTGVKIYDVSAEGGATTAEVFTVEQATVVLEVIRNGEVLDYKKTDMEGDGTITVEAVGNRVRFHEIGCEEPMIDRSY